MLRHGCWWALPTLRSCGLEVLEAPDGRQLGMDEYSGCAICTLNFDPHTFFILVYKRPHTQTHTYMYIHMFLHILYTYIHTDNYNIYLCIYWYIHEKKSWTLGVTLILAEYIYIYYSIYILILQGYFLKTRGLTCGACALAAPHCSSSEWPCWSRKYFFLAMAAAPACLCTTWTPLA